MKILILGGSGFLSGTLSQIALSAGHEVWCVTRGQRPAPAGVKQIIADRRDTAALSQRIQETGQFIDLVVDCIGFSGEDGRQDVEVFAALARRLVFISTDFVIDPRTRRYPQTEEIADFTSLDYGRGKREAELALENSPADFSYTILRPCHIYGPGSSLGCLPTHGRDAGLLDKLRAGTPLKLVGGGHFLQQPILAEDLARLILSCAENPLAHRQTYMAAGPDIVESRRYYEIIAQVLGLDVTIEELPVDAYLADNPGALPFLCHRIYDLSKLWKHGLAAPATPLQYGLALHVQSLLDKEA